MVLSRAPRPDRNRALWADRKRGMSYVTLAAKYQVSASRARAIYLAERERCAKQEPAPRRLAAGDDRK